MISVHVSVFEMIKIEKGYVASHRSTLRFRAVEEIRQEGVWDGIDSQ